jgi:outer membrane biosynthesis protein TonB
VITSGSERLDAALLGTLRGATVPPPLPGMPTPFTATVTLHYVLIR